MVLAIIGGVVILGLIMLNAYFQRLARSEEEQRIELLVPSVLIERDQQLLRVVDLTTSDVLAAYGTRRVFPPIPDTLAFLAFCPRFKISRHLRPVGGVSFPLMLSADSF